MILVLANLYCPPCGVGFWSIAPLHVLNNPLQCPTCAEMSACLMPGAIMHELPSGSLLEYNWYEDWPEAVDEKSCRF